MAPHGERGVNSSAIDAELGAIDGIARWSEHAHGTTAYCTLYTRHLQHVLAVRPAYLAVYGVPAYSLATVRTVRPKRHRKAAAVAPRVLRVVA